MFGYPYQLEHVFSFTATVDPLEVIGPVPEGIRFNGYINGGELNGPKIRGKLRPVGGDWITLHSDGVGVLDVRLTIETDDGALILMTYAGVLDLGEDGYQKFLRQELPQLVPLRNTPRFQTAHPAYQWLNRLVCVGIGQLDVAALAAHYDVYAVK